MSTLLAVLFLVAFFMIVLPLIAWLRMGEDAAPRFEPFDATKYPNPPEVAAFLRDNVAGLEGAQFRQVADLARSSGGLFLLVTRVVLLQHPEGETATIAMMYSEKTGAALPMVEFTAELPDGRMLDVNNSVTIPIFAPRPGREVYRFPEVRDPLRLHKIYGVLVRRQFGSSTLRQRDIASDPARFLAEVMDAEHRAQMEAGYYRFDERARRWRPTLRGAFVMTWRMLPPFKQIIKAGVRSRARRALGEIAMDGPDARPVAAVTTVTLPAGTTSQDMRPRQSLLEIAFAIVFVALLCAGVIFVGRWTHNPTIGVAVFLVLAPLGVWLWARWSAAARVRKAGGDAVELARALSMANRGALPLVAMGMLATGLMGYREYQTRLPNLIVPADFDGAVTTLGQLTGHELTKLEGRDRVYVVRVRTRWANRYLGAAVPKFAAQGFFMSRFDRNFRAMRRDTSTVRLVLVPVLDPFAVVSRIGTQGQHDGEATEDIVSGLRALNAAYPFELRNAGEDWVRGAFTSPPSDLGAVIRRLDALCPRLLADDFRGDRARLELELGRAGVFICHWN